MKVKATINTILFFLTFIYSNSLQAGGVLWVGAHPDDELYVAPILADLCIKKGMQCNLLVLTDGGKGNCHKPEGCHPSVAAVRSIEMQNSANSFNYATLTMPNLEDSPAGSPDGVLESWNNSLGGGNRLLEGLVNYLKNLKPDVILTFDPRHGSSCHLDHRAVGSLVLGAATRAGIPLSSIYFPQALWVNGLTSEGKIWTGSRAIIQNDSSVKNLDASSLWLSIARTLAIHTSQFPTNVVESFILTPKQFQIQPILNAQDMNLSDSRYFDLCPQNDRYWPGQAPN